MCLRAHHATLCANIACGPTSEILQIHQAVTAKVRAVKDALKRCEVALREANAPAPAFERAAAREALQKVAPSTPCFAFAMSDTDIGFAADRA